MMILAYYVFVGLLSSTSGQTPPVLTISNNYVIKPGNVTITCTVVGNISDTVVISKDGRNIFRCLTPAIPCSNLGNVSAYSTFQNETAGTTTMRINASEISRDAGNWACRYGTTSTSAPVSLAVVTPPPSRRLIEESGYIILELNCTYPNSSLGLTFYLGPARYTEGSLVESSVPCNAPEASLNYTLKFPSQHSGSYNGTFIVSVNNGFYNISINGGTLYTFSNSTSKTTVTTATTIENGTTQYITSVILPDSTTGPAVENKNQMKTQSVAVIIGGSVGGGFVLILLIIIIICYKKKDKTRIYRDCKVNEVSEAKPNKQSSNAPIQSGAHASYQTKNFNKDWKDKCVPNENEFQESKHGKQETYELGPRPKTNPS